SNSCYDIKKTTRKTTKTKAVFNQKLLTQYLTFINIIVLC
ncbi:hypothetical protein DOY81_010746, partial [Sarcophaga bullata]